MLLNIGGHGLGDCILSLQISYFLSKLGVTHKNLISTRIEVFEPLKYIFKNQFKIFHIDEKFAENNQIISNSLFQEELKNIHEGNEIIFNVPDLLFKHPLAFNYDKYHISPQIIKKQRLLNTFTPKENIIYCGLSTSTENYVYKDIPLLIKKLSEALPNWTIYFPLLTKWDKPINNLGNFEINYSDNVIIDRDPKFEDSLNILKKSKYGIFTCNGPSHIAYHLGIPRLILDPQFGKLPWISRWKEDYEDCVPINVSIDEIVTIVTNNILVPQTQLFDRKFITFLEKNVTNPNNLDWSHILYFKY